MAPSIAVDDLSDFTPNLPAKSTTPRTLLLSPPSLSSHPDKLNDVVAAHDRSATDIQMLDRLSLSLVSLPDATYDIILLLTDADGTRTESKKILTQPLLSRVVQALKPGGRLTSQDGRFATDDQQERADSIFAGLIWEDSKLVRPSYEAAASVPLRLGRKKENGTESATTSAAGTGAVTLNLNGKRKNGPTEIGAPAGVGFVDFSDDLDFLDGNGSDEELIDEDSLLTEEDLNRAVVQRKYICRRSSMFHPLTRGGANSTRMQTQEWKTTTSLQRLHVRSGTKAGGGGCSHKIAGRPEPGEVEVG